MNTRTNNNQPVGVGVHGIPPMKYQKCVTRKGRQRCYRPAGHNGSHAYRR
jgi:hypothetical protein